MSQHSWENVNKYHKKRSLISELPPTKSNFWVASENHIFARWIIKFADSSINKRDLLRLITQIHQLGAHSKVADFRGGGSFKGQFYENVIENRLESGTRFSLFEFCAGHQNSDCFYIAATFAFVKNAISGAIDVHSYNNPGKLLRELRPADIELYGNEYMMDISPIMFEGFSVKLEDDMETVSTDNATLEIILNTDIWFPWVVGYMEDKPAEKPEGMYDNRQLALRHSDGLNEFLSGVKSLTEEIGAKWELAETHPMYQWMIHETGIRLDATLDNTKTLLNYSDER